MVFYKLIRYDESNSRFQQEARATKGWPIMWKRLAEPAKAVLRQAGRAALEDGNDGILPEHLLLAMLQDRDPVGKVLIERLRGNLVTISARLRTAARSQAVGQAAPSISPEKEGHGEIDGMALSVRGAHVMEWADAEAQALDQTSIGPEHLLMGLLREGEGAAFELLAEAGITLEKIRAELGNPLLSLDEAAKFLGISRPTLYRLLSQGDLTGLKAGRQWRFRKADLNRYLKRGPVAALTPVDAVDAELKFFQTELVNIGLTLPEEDETLEDVGERKIAQLLAAIVRLAIARRASDIHAEPTRQDGVSFFLLRYRQEGALREVRRLPMRLQDALLLRAKIEAGAEGGEKRLPQDGRILLTEGEQEFELHPAFLPTLFGEAVTVRIVDRSQGLVTLAQIGIGEEHPLREWLARPNGLILFSGPTGSGKTTTLIAALQAVAGPERKAMSVENPITYTLPHVTQTQVHERFGLTFGTILNAIWRQDPDIVMLGELPDREAAVTANELALTGHLVLCQLPMSSAAETVQQLLDMGVEPFLLARTLTGVVSQRLVRRLCAECKTPAEFAVDDPLLEQARLLAAAGGYEIPTDAVFLRGRGCERCRHTGYRGRVALYELLPATRPIVEAVLHRADAAALSAIAVEEGMRTLAAEGVRQAVEGQTSLEEALRAIMIST
jgi:excisionase family DNA binding protein